WLAFRPANLQPAWLAIELLGLGIFGLLAVLGLKRSPWFLAIGIVGHGIVWDVSHRTAPFMPSWYAIMCLLVDVGLGLYAAARIPGWRRPGPFRNPPAPSVATNSVRSSKGFRRCPSCESTASAFPSMALAPAPT